MAHYRIEVLTQSNADELGALRRLAYKNRFGSLVDTDKLGWNQNDILFLNLGLLLEGQLVSCLRVSVIETDREFHRITLQDAPADIKYPCVVLSRGATHPDHKSRGLHTILRREALSLIKAAGLNDTFGFLEDGSPRLTQLAELGYSFETCPKPWGGFLKNTKPVVLARLRNDILERAIYVLDQKIKNHVETIERRYDDRLAVLRLKTHSHRVAFEKINLEIDNRALWEEVAPVLKQVPRFDRSPAVGTWTLQTSKKELQTDDRKKKPFKWFLPYNGPNNIGPTWTPQNQLEAEIDSIQDLSALTPTCTPGIRALFAKLESLGLNPRRGLLLRMPPRTRMNWHQDGSSYTYQTRLHIPLFTNEACYFESQFGKVHMAADGNGYFVHINRPHRACNDSDFERYHIICHVWDTRHITKNHRYSPALYTGETEHENEIDFVKQYNFDGENRLVKN